MYAISTLTHSSVVSTTDLSLVALAWHKSVEGDGGVQYMSAASSLLLMTYSSSAAKGATEGEDYHSMAGVRNPSTYSWQKSMCD